MEYLSEAVGRAFRRVPKRMRKNAHDIIGSYNKIVLRKHLEKRVADTSIYNIQHTSYAQHIVAVATIQHCVMCMRSVFVTGNRNECGG